LNVEIASSHRTGFSRNAPGDISTQGALTHSG
jgi:hypothetical protein